MFTEVRVDERRGAARVLVQGSAWDALGSSPSPTGFLTGVINPGNPPVVQVNELLPTTVEPEEQPVIGIYRVVGAGLQTHPEAQSATWTRVDEPHVRLLIHRSTNRTTGTFWLETNPSRSSVAAESETPLWRRHRLAFVLATALPALGAIVLAMLPSVQTSPSKGGEAQAQPKVSAVSRVPVPITTAPANYRPLPGEAVLISAADRDRANVNVRVVVDSKGNVISARLVDGQKIRPDVAEEVLKAVRQTRYEPHGQSREFVVSLLLDPGLAR